MTALATLFTIHEPGTTVLLTDGSREWKVLVNTVNLRAGGFVAYEVSWLTDGGRVQLWVEACELKRFESTPATVSWFHRVEEGIR
jgi:hypothetical protein